MKHHLHTRQITFRQLEIFRAVAQRSSVTQAADALHLAQPTVSTQIAKLNQAIGQPLFEQVGKHLFLTDMGKTVLATSQRIFAELEHLEGQLASHANLESGQLRLAVVTTAKYFVPKWLGAFLTRYPKIEPSFQIGNRADILQRLRENRDDIYIFSHLPQAQDIHSQPLLSNPLVLVAPNDHPLHQLSNPCWQDVLPYRMLVRETGSGTRFAVDTFFRQFGKPHQPLLTVASNEAIKASVAAGLGVSIISKHALNEATAGIKEVPLPQLPIATMWYWVWPKGKPPSPAVQAFMDMVQTTLETQAGHI
jgi:DNA-binding transcriptional LysR family regulator